MKNRYKKADAQGNELPEQIGKGLTEHWIKIEPEIIELKGKVMTFRISEDLKNEFMACTKDTGKLLRSFVRGYVAQNKKK